LTQLTHGQNGNNALCIYDLSIAMTQLWNYRDWLIVDCAIELDPTNIDEH
jgi:hypothetical protein